MKAQQLCGACLLPFDFVLYFAGVDGRFTQGTGRTITIACPGAGWRDLRQTAQSALLGGDSFPFCVVFDLCHRQPVASIGPAPLPAWIAAQWLQQMGQSVSYTE